MNNWKKILIPVIAVFGFLLLGAFVLIGVSYYVWFVAIDEVYTGHEEGITLSEAKDSPVELPSNASNIYFAYELYWQGGASVARYDFSEGDIKHQAASHLRSEVDWVQIDSTVRPTVPEHQFQNHAWFQPADILSGYESASSGILWEPKVWIDDGTNTIYVLDQN
jgi:hypothetical protein